MPFGSRDNYFAVESLSRDALLNEIRNFNNFVDDIFDVPVDVDEQRLHFFDDLNSQWSLNDLLLSCILEHLSSLVDCLDDIFHNYGYFFDSLRSCLNLDDFFSDGFVLLNLCVNNDPIKIPDLDFRFHHNSFNNSVNWFENNLFADFRHDSLDSVGDG